MGEVFCKIASNSWGASLLSSNWQLQTLKNCSVSITTLPSPPEGRIFVEDSKFDSCKNIQILVFVYFFEYDQQDAKLYSILYYCQCSTCFRRFLRPSSGVQELYTLYSIGQACLLLPLAWVSWNCSSNSPTLAVAASKLGIYPMLCVKFLSSWWWAEKPPETCRALTIIKNIYNLASCWSYS